MLTPLSQRRCEKVNIDSIVTQDQSHTSKVTTHAIEDGADISDHSENVGSDLSLGIILTDDTSLLSTTKPMHTRLSIMNEWREEGELLTFYTPRKIMSSLLIVSVKESVSQATGWGTSYTMKLKKVKIFGLATRDINLPTYAIRLLKQGISTAKTQAVGALVKADIPGLS